MTPPDRTGPTPAEPAPGRRVVVAEDEALIRLDLREMLEEEGWTVVGEAGDGETAVRLAEELRPDLVLLDVQMPVLDGLAAAERIARQRLAPVVMLTAFGQRDLVERAREAGAMAYLVKPFAKKDLLPAVEMAVSRFSEIVGLEAEVSGLQERLEARKAVERAKGVLQAEHGMTEPQAFRWIQTTSMNRRLSMRAVAEAVLTEAGAQSPLAGRPPLPGAGLQSPPQPERGRGAGVPAAGPASPGRPRATPRAAGPGSPPSPAGAGAVPPASGPGTTPRASGPGTTPRASEPGTTPRASGPGTAGPGGRAGGGPSPAQPAARPAAPDSGPAED